MQDAAPVASFRALVLRNENSATRSAVETLDVAALPNEDTLVKVDYSTLNFKDALAVTGRGKIVRTWPLVPGIDFSGTVVQSSNARFAPGTEVVLTGWSVGEKYWGGYAQYQRVKSDWLVALPDGLNTRQAMMAGTAGFEAMLAIDTLEKAGVGPAGGPVLVTGAAGGVGAIAVAILSALGYEVAALTRTEASQARIAKLGAKEFVNGPQWAEQPRALERGRWAAAIDTVGSRVLARVLAEMRYGGAVAACGLAGGADLPTTVMPFILRGVSLLGVDSVMQPRESRVHIWQRIARELPREKLEAITTETIPLERIAEMAAKMLDHQLNGRVLVDVNRAR